MTKQMRMLHPVAQHHLVQYLMGTDQDQIMAYQIPRRHVSSMRQLSVALRNIAGWIDECISDSSLIQLRKRN